MSRRGFRVRRARGRRAFLCEAPFTRVDARTMDDAWFQWLVAFGPPPLPETVDDQVFVLRCLFFLGAMAFADLLQEASTSRHGVHQLRRELHDFNAQLRLVVTEPNA